VPLFQKAYVVIASPSASLAVNSDEAANSWPCVALRFDTVTTGGVSTNAVGVAMTGFPLV
jgi:hypothetical protein